MKNKSLLEKRKTTIWKQLATIGTALALSVSPLCTATVTAKADVTFYAEQNGLRKSGWMNYHGLWFYLDKKGKVETGWTKVKNNWYYMDFLGIMQTGWLKNNDNYYFLRGDGTMKTGWLKNNGSYYFLRGDGTMKTGWLKNQGAYYYLRNDGTMKTGWLQAGNTYYYMNSSGEMQTGWERVNGNYYYLRSDGSMKTGWLKKDGLWYFLKENGTMQTGWLDQDHTSYYFNSSGEMKTGWVNIDGVYYFFDQEGKKQTGWLDWNGKRYYLDEDGRMQTGWVGIGNKSYYMNSSGEMQTGLITVDGITYWFQENGILQEGDFIVTDPKDSTLSLAFKKSRLLKNTWYELTGDTGEEIRYINENGQFFSDSSLLVSFLPLVWKSGNLYTLEVQNAVYETREVKVVDEPEQTVEIPVMEWQIHDICNQCGAIIDHIEDEHMKESSMRYVDGEIPWEEVCSGWRCDMIQVQIGSKTERVPEKSHVETQTILVSPEKRILTPVFTEESLQNATLIYNEKEKTVDCTIYMTDAKGSPYPKTIRIAEHVEKEIEETK